MSRPYDLCSKLPYEVVAHIFTQCLPSSNFVAPNRHDAPMLLSQVSASWRSNCFSTPRLWSSLSIDLRRRAWPGVMKQTELAMIGAWLSRAAGCPLSIYLASDTFIDQDLWNMFFSFSSQWRHIKINSCPPAKFPHKLEVPLLETFELIFQRHDNPDYVQQPSSMLHWSSASRLRRFGWVIPEYEYHSSSMDLDWSRLTHLALNAPMSVADCLDIFERSQALTHVAFQCVATLRSFPSRPDLIYLPQLQSFSICADHDITSLLDSLVLPNIHEFVFNSVTSRVSSLWPQSSFLRFIDRSSCALRNLHIYDSPSTTDELLDCLRHTQTSLISLTLQSHGIPLVNDEVLDLLTVVDGRCLCPKLRGLALYNCISCSPGRVAEMVQSRMNTTMMPSGTNPQAVARMELVEMYEYETELEPLKDLINQGLILKVYSSTGGNVGLSPEDALRLQNLAENDYILQIYDPATGQFWEVDD
jgi:F-box-like